jgi:hypothetical protein
VEVVRLISSLIRDHVTGHVTSRQAASALFAAASRLQGDDHRLQPHVAQWRDTSNWGLRKAHISADGSMPSESDLDAGFELFEVALITLIGGASEAMDEIDALLSETNP